MTEREHGHVAVIGLARSGRAAARLLARRGRRVYVSDSGDSPELRAAAVELASVGVEVDVGRHDLERVANAALVVVSPGAPPDAPPLQAARRAGVPVLSEVAVALDALRDSRVIAVTGTNGKSTTTALIAHLLTTLGRNAVAAGNIGRALSEIALEEPPADWIALEISSFQLHDTPALAPHVGVLTNLAPDHLDRYASVEEYYADKRLLFEGATAASRWVTNADDGAVQAMGARTPGTHFTFSVRAEAPAWYDSARRILYLAGEPLCRRDELRMLGTHNVANALAAALAVAVAQDDPADPRLRAGIAAGLASFPGLPHRLEVVAEREDVLWVNDSKATNVESARVSLEAIDRRVIVLLGGRHKGESYATLAPALRERARCVLAYGEAAPLIERDLRAAGVGVRRMGSDFAQVVAEARAAAHPGDAVLLAPACSSFDMFRDYEERGSRFRTLVEGR